MLHKGIRKRETQEEIPPLGLFKKALREQCENQSQSVKNLKQKAHNKRLSEWSPLPEYTLTQVQVRQKFIFFTKRKRKSQFSRWLKLSRRIGRVRNRDKSTNSASHSSGLPYSTTFFVFCSCALKKEYNKKDKINISTCMYETGDETGPTAQTGTKRGNDRSRLPLILIGMGPPRLRL